jgi:hypothetical protein
VKAWICERPEEWKWSSSAARAGLVEAPAWLTIDPLAGQLGADRAAQQRAYRELVLAGAGLHDDVVESPIASMFLGSCAWIERVQRILDGGR